MTSNDPLVTVLTPAYNSAAFIGETVESVLHQTCPDFEMIVIDDGSTDGTLDAVRAAARGDRRVVTLSSAHGGPAAARNVGLEHARGRFITLLDSDDTWDSRYLASQLAILERHPEISILSANVVNRGGPRDGLPFWPVTSGIHELAPHEPIERDDAVCVFAMFRREVVNHVGAFDPAYTGNEDYEFWLRAINAGFRVMQNRTVLGRYRRRPGSVSSDDVRMLGGIIAVLESVARLPGRLEPARPAIERRLSFFREELVKAEVRASLEKRDGVTASKRLRALSRLRGDWRLAAGAWMASAWPGLAVFAYGFRRALMTRRHAGPS